MADEVIDDSDVVVFPRNKIEVCLNTNLKVVIKETTSDYPSEAQFVCINPDDVERVVSALRSQRRAAILASR